MAVTCSVTCSSLGGDMSSPHSVAKGDKLFAIELHLVIAATKDKLLVM